MSMLFREVVDFSNCKDAQAWGISYLHDASPEVNQMAQPFIPNLANNPLFSGLKMIHIQQLRKQKIEARVGYNEENKK